MSVSTVSSYYNATYQWQAQQLKSSGTSSASSQAASLFGNTSMIDQISSMIELTKYAMDAMGVGSDARVTFSQISKYREQLQDEFTQGVKQGLAASGISDIAALSFSIDASGGIAAIGGNAQDRALAQAWLDANPSIGKNLRASLDGAGVSGAVDFRVAATGNLTAINSAGTKIQNALDADAALNREVRSALEEIGAGFPVDFGFDEAGKLVASGADAQAVNEWLAANPALEETVKKQMAAYGIEPGDISLRLGQTGAIQTTVKSQELADIQGVLSSAADTGKKLYTSLDNLGIDPNINFSIQVNDNGSISVVSDHPDRDKVQAFFDANPELVKTYRQIETLAGIDDARKAMQIAPSEMRKRIQIESMASWWASSGDSSSYFGNYGGGQMSLLSGLNLTV